MNKKVVKTKRAAAILFVIGLLFALLAAGCAEPKAEPKSEAAAETRGFTDFGHIEAEYLETIRSLNWPEGIDIPETMEGEDSGTSFQIGWGETRASNLWEYSWMQEWLDTYNTDPKRAEKALEELETAFDMPYMGENRCDDATRAYLRENIEKAKNGDPSGFEECIEVNYAG